MLMEWTPKQGGHNFGDFIPSLFDRIFSPKAWNQIISDETRSHFLIGSVIANDHLLRSIEGGRQPVFWGCGHRGSRLKAEAIARAVFVGCRGFGTQRQLRNHGLKIPVVGDPGTLVKLIVKKTDKTSEKILIPHLHDHSEYDPNDVGCDTILNPLVANQPELLNLIQRISGASFILAGSLHAAIVASAYGVPFAFFKTSYLDCPPKWSDWASSVALTNSNVKFHQHAREGEQWYRDIKRKLRPTKLAPLLAAAEKIGATRSSLTLEAHWHDLELPGN